jgi:membrane protein implicated in regulation of membrane protease activity
VNPFPILLAAISAHITAVAGFVAQINQSASTTDTSLWISGAASTATASALVYLVRKIAAGELVHRSSSHAEAELVELTVAVTKLAEEAQQRESDYRQILIGRTDDIRRPPT